MINFNSFGVLWGDATKDHSLFQNRGIVFHQCEINIRNGVQEVYELKMFLFQLESTKLIWCSCKWSLTPCRPLQLKALSKGDLIDFSMFIRLQSSGWILSCWLRQLKRKRSFPKILLTLNRGILFWALVMWVKICFCDINL